MHTAPARFAPSIDTLRLLRHLARGTSNVSHCSGSRARCRRWQHSTAQQEFSPASGLQSEGGLQGVDCSLDNVIYNTGFVPLARQDRREAAAQEGPFSRHAVSPDGWATLLESEERLQGSTGVKAVLQWIRSHEVDLPVHGIHATQTWNILSKYTDIHEELVQYAIELRERAGLVYWYLWRKVIAACLRGERPDDARELHDRMRTNGMILRGQLARLARGVPLNHASLTAFRYVYLSSTERDVYEALVYRLANRGLHDMAVAWHKLLVEHGDLPSEKMQKHPFLKEMQRSDLPHSTASSISAFLTVQVAPQQHLLVPQSGGIEITTPKRPLSTGSRLTREIMSRILGDVHGVKPINISDHVCARFFATTSFPVDFVITGLAAFGVNDIGPLALRQLALRCDTTAELLQKIDQIKKAGLSIHQSTFSAAVLKLASEGRSSLLLSMLSSDQDPDVLSDKQTQMQLLQKHISAEDWKSAHWTLYVLMHFHAETSSNAWNQLVQYQAKHSNWSIFAKVLEDVSANSIRLSPTTISQLLKHRLRPRRQGRRPVLIQGEKDELLFLTNFMRGLLGTGQAPPTTAWEELSRRFGMTGRWHDLSHLLVYLAQQYSPNNSATSTGEKGMNIRSARMGGRERWQMRKAIERTYEPSDPRHPLRQLFPPSRQQAIVDWGFKAGFAELESFFRNQFRNDAKVTGLETYSFRSTPQYQHLSSRIAKRLPKAESFPLRGLILLRQLQGYGVHIDTAAVRRTVENKLWMLYGPSGFSNIKANRRARMINPWTLEEMLAGVQEITGRPLRNGNTADATTTALSRDEDLTRIPHNATITAVHAGVLLHPRNEDGLSLGNQSRALAETGDAYQLRLQRVLPETASDVLKDIQQAEKTRKLHRSNTRVLSDEDHLQDLSQRGELQRRVRLAVAFFGLGRYTHRSMQSGGQKPERMTLPMYVDLVKHWAHRRLKRKLGISGALARPKRSQPFVPGGRLQRSAVRRGVVSAIAGPGQDSMSKTKHEAVE